MDLILKLVLDRWRFSRGKVSGVEDDKCSKNETP